ncbi:hypothetical protein ENSA5_70170 [Enhygromyxa salina]|uniref:Pyrrolo-quinoline quinone repeat domain-containing protein n=1 Tax=Enhygromyxa salina TaxID=215803 RepID=A0A2S9XAT9_9BACT|nr:DUF4215 domain-containing protein [Enhygromyxa salina]PRP89910.1 hypothetical protein ENSA5_70170 [Enhygromyxa salina]
MMRQPSPLMQTQTLRLTLLTLAFASGSLVSGCRVARPNAEHCFHAAGDQTCAERDPSLPFCVTPDCGDAAYGCVAEQPEPECYSPCGGSSNTEQDDSCLEIAADTGNGDPDLPSECGDGEVGPGEECDDANTIDDDECTNACTLPLCGDGIVQLGNDEQCDDANDDLGDGCTACQLPGALIWEQVLDLGAQAEDIGHRVVIDSEENLNILLSTDGTFRLTEYDPEGASVWSQTALENSRPSLAIGSDDQLVIGGTVDDQGVTRLYDTDGNLQWTQILQNQNTGILDVAIDNLNYVVSAGYFPVDAGLLARYDLGGTEDWSSSPDSAISLSSVLITPDDLIWVVRESPHRLDRYDDSGSFVGLSPTLPTARHEELVADAEGNVYLLSARVTSFRVNKYNTNGTLLWSIQHEGPNPSETGDGIAVLPGGGVVVAGTTYGEQISGMLSWYGADGKTLAPDVVVNGLMSTDASEFLDVAVSPNGYGIAVGSHQPDGLDADLWIQKFGL